MDIFIVQNARIDCRGAISCVYKHDKQQLLPRQTQAWVKDRKAYCPSRGIGEIPSYPDKSGDSTSYEDVKFALLKEEITKTPQLNAKKV